MWAKESLPATPCPSLSSFTRLYLSIGINDSSRRLITVYHSKLVANRTDLTRGAYLPLLSRGNKKSNLTNFSGISCYVLDGRFEQVPNSPPVSPEDFQKNPMPQAAKAHGARFDVITGYYSKGPLGPDNLIEVPVAKSILRHLA